MNNDKDTFLPASSEDEALGRLLSGGLVQTDAERSRGCPGPEAIAAVVDGTAGNEERDRVLKHVSACDDCYEMFLLTAELKKEEEARPGTYKMIRWKTMALAASLMIVVFSLYVFYRSSEVPKTPRELMEKSDSMKAAKGVEGGVERGVEGGVEGGVLSEVTTPAPPAKPGIARKRKRADKEEDTAAADKKSVTAPIGFAKREEISKTAEKDAPAEPIEIPEEKIAGKRLSKKGIPKKEMELKENAPKKQDTRDKDTFGDDEAVTAEKARRERGKTGRQYLAKKQVRQQLEAADESRHLQKAEASKRMIQRQSIPVSEKKTAAQAKQVEPNVAAVQAPIPREGQRVPIQSQAVQLNMMVEGVDSYLPRKELENLFKDSIVLSQQLGEEYEIVRQNAVTTGNLNEVKSYEKGLKPLIKIKTVGDKTYISPNIYWFYSRSAPRTVEHHFFSLARTGWCPTVSQCYKTDRPTARLVAGETRGRLLVQWQTLQPQLTGVFKEVAVNTITQLEKTDK